MGKDIVTGCLPVTDCVLFGGNVEISLLSMVVHVRLVIRLTASFHARIQKFFPEAGGGFRKITVLAGGLGGSEAYFW